jgi:hypothetical protein
VENSVGSSPAMAATMESGLDHLNAELLMDKNAAD